MAILYPGMRGNLSSVLERFDLLEFNGTSSFGEHTFVISEINSTGAPFCFSAYIYPHDVSRDQTIFEFGKDSPWATRSMGILYNGGNPRFFHGSYIGSTYTRTVISDDNISTGQWYHVMVNGSNNAAYLLVDGKQSSTATGSDANYTIIRTDASLGRCFLGCHIGASEFFDGLLAYPAFFDDNLSLSGAVDSKMRVGSNPLEHYAHRSNFISLYAKKETIVAGEIRDLTANTYDLTNTDIDGIKEAVAFPPDGPYTTGFPSVSNSWHSDGNDAGANGKAFINLRGNYSFTDDIGTGDFSFLIRFKFDSLAAAQDVLCITDNSASFTSYFRLTYSTSLGGGGLFVTFRESGSSYSGWKIIDPPVIDTWYTVAFTRTGNSFKCWVDGGSALDQTGTNHGTMATAWANSTSYSIGDIRSYSSQNYVATSSGTSSGTSPLDDVGVSWNIAHINTNGGSDEIHLGRWRTTYDGIYLDGNIAQFVLWNDAVITDANKTDLYNSGVVQDVRADSGAYVADESKIVCQLVPQADVSVVVNNTPTTRYFLTNYSKGVIVAENDGEGASQRGSYEAEVSA